MMMLKRYGWMVGLILIFLFVFAQGQEENPVATPVKGLEVETGLNDEIDEPKEMKVDLKGEVVKPGVYVVKAGMRVDDVISMAGGMTGSADVTSINLAQLLQDEMVILVLPIGESAPTSASSASVFLPINQATKEEIEGLSGIGPSKAQAIVDYREEHGPFSSKEELLNISGIGEKTLEGMEDEIRIP
ncbi:helix-hairpin-helix domain-containing protein [Halobacillus locisalis]|uniref:Helix-hairpin-helix domain-containing protein n=1 Tax=Halobacillus locisalis TaxID=220753 RepID=A0A838CNC0_9BACI|nr:helix-hairpin-helix domain-containing protein [Halobacillus locisalis]MBA2173530.1 helix-hairpin-helix domain-containing protein [Halobacillus locisalis]